MREEQHPRALLEALDALPLTGTTAPLSGAEFERLLARVRTGIQADGALVTDHPSPQGGKK